MPFCWFYRAAAQIIMVSKAKCTICFNFQVFPDRYNFPGGNQADWNERPRNGVYTARILHADRFGGTGHPRVNNTTTCVPNCNQKKSIPFHVQNVEGCVDGLGNCIKVNVFFLFILLKYLAIYYGKELELNEHSILIKAPSEGPGRWAALHLF